MSGCTKSAQYLAEALCNNESLDASQFVTLIQNRASVRARLQTEATARRVHVFGNAVYKRALIECTSYCKNNCDYCGIRAANTSARRVRLTQSRILDCCKTGYALGFRSFVLQGGEDPCFDADFVASTVRLIRGTYGDCAITLSFGEQSAETYALWKESGADRYLLRHEAANDALYAALHAHEHAARTERTLRSTFTARAERTTQTPQTASEAQTPRTASDAQTPRTARYRKECLFTLKKLGYQTGSGFMVGAPYQTAEHLAEDLLFLRDLQPEMIGIGPYIAHKDTPFAACANGSAELTTFLISVLRIMFPRALIPATTALETLAADGSEQGILAGANVLMIGVASEHMRRSYALYEGKTRTAREDAADCVLRMQRRLGAIGCTFSPSRGDYGENGEQ